MQNFTTHDMKKPIYLLLLTFLTNISYGQTTIQTKEIKIQYINGNELFNICTTGCATTFEDNKEYFWCTEFSTIKSTKGGSGGNLLHGNYKHYDENGNLRQYKNYYLGLLDGDTKDWDSLGNITSKAKYSKGNIIYWKFQNKSKFWVETNGGIFKEGRSIKIYTQNNSLISEKILLPNFSEHTKTFYENSGKIKEDYTSSGGDYLEGKYTSYFENGKIEVEGQYFDRQLTNIKVGTWKWYKSDGTIDYTQKFKANVEKWPNGEIKVLGGYIFDIENNSWVKTDEWRWYTEDGKFQSSKKYKWGVEFKE